MLTVGKDPLDVERRLEQRRLCCPDCAGLLVPWGRARQRTVWGAGWRWRFCPRRAICRGCGRTHVLMPVNVLWHRRDDVGVIGEAIVRSVAGQGFRVIARLLDRPQATVRGWLRRMRACAERIRVCFTTLLGGLDPDPPALAVAGSAVADAVNAVAAAVAAAGRRFPELVVAGLKLWEVACAVTGGRLLAPAIAGFGINTNRTLVTLRD